KMGEEQVLRIHGRVRLQLRPEIAVVELLPEEPRLRALDDQVEPGRFEVALAADHEMLLLTAPSWNQRTAFSSASRTGVWRRPNSRTARRQSANITSRAVRTPSRGTRGARCKRRWETNASAWAIPSASAWGRR